MRARYRFGRIRYDRSPSVDRSRGHEVLSSPNGGGAGDGENLGENVVTRSSNILPTAEALVALLRHNQVENVVVFLAFTASIHT